MHGAMGLQAIPNYFVLYPTLSSEAPLRVSNNLLNIKSKLPKEWLLDK